MSREDDLLQELNAARADETRRRQEEELRRIRAEEKLKMQEEELRRIRAEEKRKMQEEELRRIRAEERRKMQAQGFAEDPAEARRRYEEQQLQRYRDEERLRQEQQLRQYQTEERIRQEQERARRDVEQRMMQEGMNDRQGRIQMPGQSPAPANRVQIPGQEPMRNQPEPLRRAPVPPQQVQVRERGQFMNDSNYGYPEPPNYGDDDDYDYEEERRPRPPKRKKKKNPVARFFRNFFIVILALLILGFLAIFSITSRFEHVETEVSKDPNSMKGDRVTILLIGQDARPGEDEQRADSMILCTIDKGKRSVVLVSLMRDMYVDIPGYGGNRLNAAYAFGGIDLLDQTIEENFGVRVDGNAVVNFDGFISAMAAVGNLDINLSAEEAAYMLEDPSAGTQNYDPVDWDLHEGMNSLDPEQVLCYARMRHVGNSDWDRTKRQRIVITTALNKVKKGHLIGGYKMALGIAPNIKTDMKTMGMLRLAWGIMTSKETKSYHLPVDGCYYDENIDGMAVLVPDLEQNRMYLEQFMNGEGEQDQ